MKKRYFFLIALLLLIISIIGIYALRTFETAENLLPLVVHTPIPLSTPSVASYVPGVPSIERIFEETKDFHIWTATLSAEKIRTITATGDIIPARSVNTGVMRRNNPFWPYQLVGRAFFYYANEKNITFANLETPLLKDCPLTDEGMIFCGSSRNVEGLKGKVNVVSLANNHAGNYGEAGVKETISLLQQHDIEVTGVNGALYKDIKGMRFAFLGYNDISKDQPGVSNANDEIIKKEVSEAKQKADIVVVTFHWGEEYRSQPDERQQYLAHLTVDAGADLIIGNHPHWIQPIEIYKGKLITYAHGNFIFDQMWSEETKLGVIGRYMFYDNQLVDVSFQPVRIEDFGQPYFLENEEKETVLRKMYEESKTLQETKRALQ